MFNWRPSRLSRRLPIPWSVFCILRHFLSQNIKKSFNCLTLANSSNIAHKYTHWPLYQVHFAQTGLDPCLPSDLPNFLRHGFNKDLETRDILLFINMIAFVAHSCYKSVGCAFMGQFSHSTSFKRCSIVYCSIITVTSPSCLRDQCEIVWALWQEVAIRRWVQWS